MDEVLILMDDFYAQKLGSMYLIVLNSNPPYYKLITLRIMTLLLTNYWGKLVRMPEGIIFTFKHTERKKPKNCTESVRKHRNIDTHHVQQRAGALETAPTVAINVRHNIDGAAWTGGCMSAACWCPISACLLTLTALTYTDLILRIFLWEIHIMQ